MSANIPNHKTGTIKEGSIFIVLKLFILSMESPEQAISTPPTIDISVIKESGIKGPKKLPKSQILPCHKKSTPAAIAIPKP